MIQTIKKRFHQWTGPGRNRFFQDDFNWNTYTRDKYGPQQQVLEREWTLQFGDDIRFDAEQGKLDTGSHRVHPNMVALYEVVGKLSPQTVYEIGCGGGDHMHNLMQLYPNMQVHGGDRSKEQLAFLRDRNPEVADFTIQQDITMPFSDRWGKSDLVYSQAVIMHIKTAVSHKVALSNMFRMANDYVVLMENYGCHPFVDDILELKDGGHLAWDSVHFYAHRMEGQPYCLVVSREPCDLEPMTDYFAFPSAQKRRYLKAA